MPRPARPPAPARSPAIRPRVYLSPGVAVGPGKIDLLRQVDATRSISAAARAMGMSYKRAWQLVDVLNRDFGSPVVATATGGRGGGGATLTPLGRAWSTGMARSRTASTSRRPSSSPRCAAWSRASEPR